MWFRRKQQAMVTPRRKPKQHEAFTLATFLFWLKPFAALLGLVTLALVVSNWQAILESLDRTPIRSYAVTHKTQFTTSADIRERLAAEPALKGYFGQDIREVEQKILSIPWINAAIVRKQYPDRLNLTLFEHHPVAVWNDVNFLSDKGVVFSLPADRQDKTGLPILYGPDSEGIKVLEAWTKIKADLTARHLALKSVAVDNRGSWRITLSNDVELRLGRGEWTPKIDRFVAIFPHIEMPEGKRLAYVDLRYEHGAAVGFRPQF